MTQTTIPPQRERASGYWRQYLRGAFFAQLYTTLYTSLSYTFYTHHGTAWVVMKKKGGGKV